MYIKYSKHYLLWHTQLTVCSKILNRGLNHGFLFSMRTLELVQPFLPHLNIEIF